MRQYNSHQSKISGDIQTQWSQQLQQILIKSEVVAEDLKDTHINCEHLLLALIKYDVHVSVFLKEYSVTYDAVKVKVQTIRA